MAKLRGARILQGEADTVHLGQRGMAPDADRGGSEGESTSTSAAMAQHMPELHEQPRLAERAGAPCSPAGVAYWKRASAAA